ncbi:MAG: DUF853 family protein, partial [Thermoplasmata archaeon]|nr:DUF853 family protein [Thermoplasmata archaeon]
FAPTLRVPPSSAVVRRASPVGFLTADGPPDDGAARVAERDRGRSDHGLDDTTPIRVSLQSHWFPDRSGRLRVWTRFAVGAGDTAEARLLSAGAALARQIEEADGTTPSLRIGRDGIRGGAEWREGRLGALRCGPPLRLTPRGAAASIPLSPAADRIDDRLAQHTVVIGATGSGKTGLLARLSAERIARGTPVCVFDVHGDLAPAVVARLAPFDRRRVLAIDAESPADRIPGLAILDAGAGGAADASAADVVAALKRLSREGGEVYWGFRLERIFDTFVRLVQEEGGSLLDLSALLTDPRRREAARLTTRRPDAARFLDELPAILRRAPEFLWPAASRLSKIGLDPALAALLAPSGEGIPLDGWIAEGGSVLWRLPFSRLGPEGASLAGTLLATRTYLALARSNARRSKRLRALFVFDEAHAFSARLLTELLAEGRKFGIGVVLASQYPERLEPELRAAAAGAAGTHVVFRVPAASARTAGAWAGLSHDRAVELLPSLPIGTALETARGGPARFCFGGPLPLASGPSWAERVAISADRFHAPEEGGAGSEVERSEETILF